MYLFIWSFVINLGAGRSFVCGKWDRMSSPWFSTSSREEYFSINMALFLANQIPRCVGEEDPETELPGVMSSRISRSRPSRGLPNKIWGKKEIESDSIPIWRNCNLEKGAVGFPHYLCKGSTIQAQPKFFFAILMRIVSKRGRSTTLLLFSNCI